MASNDALIHLADVARVSVADRSTAAMVSRVEELLCNIAAVLPALSTIISADTASDCIRRSLCMEASQRSYVRWRSVRIPNRCACIVCAVPCAMAWIAANNRRAFHRLVHHCARALTLTFSYHGSHYVDNNVRHWHPYRPLSKAFAIASGTCVCLPWRQDDSTESRWSCSVQLFTGGMVNRIILCVL